ncbi:MAG: hypothetical protein JRI73_12980 [Deltaproteobacteria bacterium]|nr:hypothetical protein [Deltaproteobacteria bacterium]
MKVNSTNQTSDLESRLNEAKMYNSMGLHADSIGVYEKILSDFPELPSHTQKKISEKIEHLKNRISDLVHLDIEKVSVDHMSIIKKTLTSHENVQSILDSASAFKELGLFEEAIDEYEKLFHLGYPPEKNILLISECLLKIYSPSKVAAQVAKVISDQRLEKEEKARINFQIGMEMEKRDRKELAVDFYRSAKEIDPENNEINTTLDSLIAGLSTGVKYDYLINQGMVTKDQLQQSIGLSMKTEKSVEFVLVEFFKIGKEDLGKCSSLFYGCPFRSYDPELPTPVELIRKMSWASLLHELWVPLSWGREGIEILVDDPEDVVKTDRIKALLKTEKINFSVGIREDIEAFIIRFFGELKHDKSSPVENMVEGSDLIPDVRKKLVEMRREERSSPTIPEFFYVEFKLGKPPEKEKSYKLNVIDYSRHGLGLLVTEKDAELLKMLNPGDRIKDITFYATWTFIQVDTTVRHITKIKNEPHKGLYIIGVESGEIIESSLA